ILSQPTRRGNEYEAGHYMAVRVGVQKDLHPLIQGLVNAIIGRERAGDLDEGRIQMDAAGGGALDLARHAPRFLLAFHVAEEEQGRSWLAVYLNLRQTALKNHASAQAGFLSGLTPAAGSPSRPLLGRRRFGD